MIHTEFGALSIATVDFEGAGPASTGYVVEDVDRAARCAFPSCASTSCEERLSLLQESDCHEQRYDEFVSVVTLEMDAPATFSRTAQAATGIDHLKAAIKAPRSVGPLAPIGNTSVHREPVGICALFGGMPMRDGLQRHIRHEIGNRLYAADMKTIREVHGADRNAVRAFLGLLRKLTHLQPRDGGTCTEQILVGPDEYTNLARLVDTFIDRR